MDALIALLKTSTVFDETWYYETYLDVKAAAMDAAEHYLKYGTAMGRNPGPGFNTSFYLKSYQDVADSGMNPLLHYLEFGAREGRKPSEQVKASSKNETSQEEAARSKVRELRTLLLNLGFHKRALADFNTIVETTSNSYLRQLAAWELAVWHANRCTQEDATECLRLLTIVKDYKLDTSLERRIAILYAEACDLLTKSSEAQGVLQSALQKQAHADLYLAYSRYQKNNYDKLAVINKALQLHGLSEISLRENRELKLYDRLSSQQSQQSKTYTSYGQPKVSVIVPAYNAAASITTTLESLLAQSWKNLEIIVADDCSSDTTAQVVANYLAQDQRLQLIQNPENSGPYVARNRALNIATGDFVTCNDADDWSHPEKIAIQVKHLMMNPQCIANTSQQARVSEDLIFHRRGNPGFYLQFNISSLMFRRDQVINTLGYWDSVRFAADSEYMRRIQNHFGKESLSHLDTGPLSFQRQTDDSLTGSASFGYHGFKVGARKTYEDNHKEFHKRSRTIYLDFPLKERPFPIPEPMQPKREFSGQQARHFDVIIASDFRMPGGTSMSNAEEIKANYALGLDTGLVQMASYHMNPSRSINSYIYQLIAAKQASLIVYGEQVSCDLLIIRLPWVLQEWQAYVPQIEAKNIRVIVNQPPKRDYSPGSEKIYDLSTCSDHVLEYFGKTAIWSPIGPLVRDALFKHHAEELQHIQLSSEDWTNIINIDEWKRGQRPLREGRIKICRHSRDQYVKWPASREELEKIYPVEGKNYSVNILGGAEIPKEILGGKLPNNWHVTEFGKQNPAKFLAKHDVFVYYTHPDWIESFGRVIFEAMAVGLPVILPKIYQPLFQDAALYAEPDEVLATVDYLMASDSVYESQVLRASSFVNRHFGYAHHAERVGKLVGKKLGEAVQPSLLETSLSSGGLVVSR